MLFWHFVLFWAFPWPSYNYSLYKFITPKPVICILVLNCSANCSGTVTSGLTLFWLELNCLCAELELQNSLSTELCYGLSLLWTVSLLLRETLADWIQNTYLDTTTASLFVTGETTVKVFILVVTVYYLRVAAWSRFYGPLSSNGRLLWFRYLGF
jgi:hypothetical protein